MAENDLVVVQNNKSQYFAVFTTSLKDRYKLFAWLSQWLWPEVDVVYQLSLDTKGQFIFILSVRSQILWSIPFI